MKLAHLILAHSQPEQLERLLGKLQHNDADIYIHLDKKTDITAFQHLAKIRNVYFIKNRVKVYWGSYNIVKATLNSFYEIISLKKNYDYLNLLSGQDYPLKPQQELHDLLAAHPGQAFMNYLLFDTEWLEAMPRVQSYHFNNFRLPGRYILQEMVNRLFGPRKMPDNMIPVGRSQWFTVSWECIIFICDHWRNTPKLRNFIKLTWGPDEFIFQTILYNSRYRDVMKNNDLRYIDWSGGGVSPKTLSIDDAEALKTSGQYFARKFDINKDKAILDMIDSEML
ncbi:beta-1,6-N-acetylglucosaminyltransferase [Mucilaginibacter auburnensis]|uniref:Peptide O-xylosyltransferase n=1 Tax=Mucilaginibacter auburnensis TaxID=1457233 RepID=A0A2H9VVW5_9SPHI|nr:beta-1,6-N-acetylglucosaminyltransferase [Mucilaginibacter auburnensis]PJJ84966.1 core-2/I-Branching enzyme [Mucilaginibacter auburnensis]